MYSKQQQLGKASPNSRPLAARQGETWDDDDVPAQPTRAQKYQPAQAAHKHVLVRNVKAATITRLQQIARNDFDGRHANWLINHVLDEYVAKHDAKQ